ncbi:lysoplasmalogenase [Alkalihalobacillus sp. 1P02AB]|uniref:lysoplasmalogenase n=1 Tax=Alkalihalobacillus sp. 1P02AB TaxID=3132260 RepID=UPI0039A5CE07
MKAFISLLILLMGSYYIFFFVATSSLATVFFKLLPMLLIIVYALFYYKKTGKHLAILVGLSVCMIADGVIIFSFIGGLVVFLIGHLFYLSAFLKVSSGEMKNKLIIIPFILYMGAMGYFLLSAILNSGEVGMVVPVVFYILVIGAMGISAVWTRNVYATIGSLLFIISDSVLAWNLFVESIPYSHVWIMTTYYGAQYFIATSIGSLKTK